jgi:hypothetical protein
MVFIEAQENQSKDIVLHVRDLMNSTPLPNLLLEDSNSTNNDNELTQPLRGQFIEYIDKACQIDAPSPRTEQI